MALLAAQLASGPRAAYGLTGAVIGTAYVLRAIGDVGSPVLTWLSPIGWFQGMHAFSGLRWWPLGLLVLAAAGVGAVALWTFGRRDHGSGVLAARPGPSRASAFLVTPFGLAWRLQRGAVIGWTLSLFLTGLSYGSLGSDVGTLLGDSATTEDMFVRGGTDLVQGFYATSIMMLALMCCGYAISTALRPRHEEASGIVEVLLATGLSRGRWLGVQVVLTVLGTFAVILAAGLGLGIGYGLAAQDFDTGWSFTLATIPYAAPVLVMSALARLLHGLAPRLASLAWVGLRVRRGRDALRAAAAAPGVGAGHLAVPPPRPRAGRGLPLGAVPRAGRDRGRHEPARSGALPPSGRRGALGSGP